MKASIAQTQATAPLSAADLDVVLALVRGGTLAAAGERLRVDASTVFRSLQRIERALGRSLFARSRAGYRPLDLAQALAEPAERVEAALEAARAVAQSPGDAVTGTVRITTTDTLLHGLLAPALAPLHAQHPQLQVELHAANELASLTRRDADIALRATRRAPPHLVGQALGPVRVAVYAARRLRLRSLDEALARSVPWIAPDDALPDHPSVAWRRRQLPRVVPTFRVNSILTVQQLVRQGLGVGVVPRFLADDRLVDLSGELSEAQSELWLLTHPESRHLRRVAVTYRHLAAALRLP